MHNKKTIIKSVLAVAAMAIIVIFVILLTRHYRMYSDIKQLPSVNLVSINGKSFNTQSMYDSDNPVVIISFHPECDFCSMEMSDILDNSDSFNNIQLLFVTFADSADVSDFLLRYPVDTIQGAIIALDRHSDFMPLFGVVSSPTSFVYDGNKRLKKVFKGLSSVETILKIVN